MSFEWIAKLARTIQFMIRNSNNNAFGLFVVFRALFRRHCEATVLSYQTARMPEQIRLKVGGVSSAQFSVYDEFARNIPGFQPMSERDAALLLQKVTTVAVSLNIIQIHLNPFKMFTI